MDKETLETNKAALELLLSENGDKCIDYKAQIAKIEQELKNIWQGSPQKEIVKFEKSKLLIDLNHDINKFEKSIKNRDRREIVAALIVIPVFIYYAYFYSHPLAKIGAIIISIAAFFVIYKLKQVQKIKKPIDITLSTKDQLIETRTYITKEMKLLDNILYWYLLPLSFGLVVFMMGLNMSLKKLLIEISIFVVLNIGIYILNKQSVKKKFLTIINNINSSIKELEAD